MAVTFGAAGTSSSGTTSCTPAYPSGISATTSKLLCAVTGRGNTAATAFTMPLGWSKIGTTELEGGTGTWGVDTGTRRVTFFSKDVTTGAETGTEAVSLAGTANNTLRATIFRVEVTSGYGIAFDGTTGADTTNGTGFSAAGSAIDLAAGDLLAILVAQNIDTGTQSAQSITASGITFGTRTNQRSDAVTNGNDHRHILDTVPVSSGSGSAAPTYAYTISVAGSGPVAFLRMRETPPPPVITLQPKNEFVIDGGNAAFSLAGTDYTGIQWQELISGGSGSVSLGSAITAVNTSSTVTSFSTAAYNQAAGDAIAVRVKWEGTATAPTGVTDTAGNTYTARTARLNGTAGVQIFDCMSTAAHASNIITVTWPGNIASYISLAPIRFTVTGTASFVAEAGSPNSGTGTAVATGAFNAGDFAVAEVGTAGTGASGTAGTGWTEDVEHGAAVGAQSMYRVDSPGGTYQALSTLGASSPWFAAAASYTVGAGSTWTDMSGETGTGLALSGVTTADDGRKFRAKLTNANGDTLTNEVTLYVSPDGRLELKGLSTAPAEAPTSTNTKSITAPGGIVQGHRELILCGLGTLGGGAPVITGPAGWESDALWQSGALSIGGGTFDLRLAAFERKADGPGSTAVVTSSAAGYWGWHRTAWAFDAEDFIESINWDDLVSTITPTLPGVTPLSDFTTLLDWMVLGMTAAVSPGSSGMTELSENTDHSIALYGKDLDDTTAVGTRTYAFSPTADAGFGVVVLRSLASDGGSGGITGTLAVTESGPDTIASSGAVLVQGTVSAAESSGDTAAATGVVVVAGSLAASESGSDMAALSGAVVVSGSLAVSEVGSDTAAITGGQVVTGSFNATETGSDSAALTGTVLIQGGLTVSEAGSDTASVAGKVLLQGAFSASESGADAAAASGAVLVQGTISAVEAGADVFAATGSLSGGITGSLSATESGSDLFVSSGAIVVTGVFAVTETGSDIAAMSGSVRVQGSVATSESGPDTFLATGSAPPEVTGILVAIEQGADGAALSGAILVSGLMSASEEGSDTALFLGSGVPASYARAPSGAGYLRTTQGNTYRPSTGMQTARPQR